MNTKSKIIQFVPAGIVLAAIGFRYFSLWCIDSISLCYGTFVHWAFSPFTASLYFFSIYIFPITIILAFVPRQIFNSWLKLAKWAVPLSIIFVAATPVSHMGISLDLFPFYRDDAARLAGEVFATVSLILIIWKSLSLRRKM